MRGPAEQLLQLAGYVSELAYLAVSAGEVQRGHYPLSELQKVERCLPTPPACSIFQVTTSGGCFAYTCF